MQEVEVPPRDIFVHYINVPTGKTITWSFSTKKKNISFGLYQRKTTGNKVTVTSSPTGTFKEESSYIKHSVITPKSSTKSSYSVSLKSKASIETLKLEENDDSNEGDVSVSDLPVASRGRKKAGSTLIIKDPDLKEILPIQHYNSALNTIKGSYKVTEEGTYCLCFDNSFSRTTSKSLSLSVTLKDDLDNDQEESKPDISGWAKRWVKIDNGLLSYYLHPNSLCRGTIHIALSTISSNQPYRAIHMDSGTVTYHFKAFTDNEFDEWMSAIRNYINLSNERQFYDPEYPRAVSRQSGDLERRQSLYFKRQSLMEKRQSISKNGDIQSYFIQNSLDEDLGKIYAVFNNMDNEFKTIENDLDNFKNVIENQVPNGHSKPAQPSPNIEGKPRKKFTLPLQRGSTFEQVTTPSQMPLDQIYEKLFTNIKTLKKEKDQAFNLLRAEIEKWKAMEYSYNKLVTENADLRKSLFMTDKIDERLENEHLDKMSGVTDINDIKKLRTISMSTITTHSDVFFDAEDIDLTEDLSATESDVDVTNSNISDEESDLDLSSQIDKPSIKDVSNIDKPIIVQRRKVLPAQTCIEEASLLSLLRKNVGKDLSTVAMPISLNEPINILQNMAEALEYSELLDKAASLDNSLDRLIHVAAFAVSGYASTSYRTRKPYNPLHGETYECVRPDKGFKFISEKVSHYPPIMACHADSPNWSFWQDSKIKSKFWGKSMELIPVGTIHIAISKYNDHFTYTKPSTCVRNMISGTKYLEHVGVMRVENQTTGEACEIKFNQSGMWSSAPKCDIVGTLTSGNGENVGKISGKWNEMIFHEKGGPNQLEVIWKANSPSPNHEQYYGFTQFCIELNELTPDIEGYLPNTDTRLRPDQRLFEDGRIHEAETEKLRLEQKQREYRKLLEERGEAWVPQWFKLEGEEWVYKGGYWEARENKTFESKLQLW
ncbi:Oxysterol-binding protein-domain-containing protein [Gigaspora margarita]|uniref:Oxysterol-binding protein-domain-containing protein n=1 Tax=Gigaspora margarita TaxID=4874 RepID=A0A8H3X914_GIGMA|nr:Oxysterol-binding protein-domain-containing protein [Gigaspora margarita]